MTMSTMLRRSFRNVAVIAGLIERRYRARRSSPPGHFQFRPDHDSCAKPETDHIRLQAHRQDAAWQVDDLKRPGRPVRRDKGPHDYTPPKRISPLARADPARDGNERVIEGTARDELGHRRSER